MIFVTVGTHEQPFNRLIKKVDDLVKENVINEKVIIQSGYSTYDAKHCEMHKWMTFSEMHKEFSDARIVITHGGPSSFIDALKIRKIPIVVPRQASFNEHINNHQVDFVKLVADRMDNIIPVYNINDLDKIILKYDEIVKGKKDNTYSNNIKFNIAIEKIVEGMFKNQ